ncbi:hypothetical protein ACFSUS_04385 [Spirosoma soli]|uniref:Uncharacterized protein n=1 Tax=Spirosoma soli TaxID=1770529 RepID=A0ABW5LYJ6_9BACT
MHTDLEILLVDTPLSDRLEAAVNLMILFPDLPSDQALVQAYAWIGFFCKQLD